MANFLSNLRSGSLGGDEPPSDDDKPKQKLKSRYVSGPKCFFLSFAVMRLGSVFSDQLTKTSMVTCDTRKNLCAVYILHVYVILFLIATRTTEKHH